MTKKMFQVFENEKPADCRNICVDESWNQSVYDSLDEAQKYAMNWLGFHAPNHPSDLGLNQRYEFGGYGDYIIIKEV